ncbi:MAG: hypothetical protein IT382_10495 [Deltaproteobacteria bacterium]|nr:hypothetical protein [Deltaproteobacteria bacterium]
MIRGQLTGALVGFLIAAVVVRVADVAPTPREFVFDVAPVRGRCDLARTAENDGAGLPPLPLAPTGEYSAVVCSKHNRAGSIRVRANAVFNGDDLGNMIGTLRSGSCVRAEGPLKDLDVPGGIGWAIPVEDDLGQRCRGYVAEHVVDDPMDAFRAW